MAKGNMFLGMARGKVGDVVFYRADGQQLSRVRNRNPRNPRSNAQLFQRAIMATIVQAYTAGKAIFDHSFQGYSVGAQNQREFLRQNAKLLRETIAADINTPITTNEQKGRVVAPGVSSPVPFSYLVSKGSYQMNYFPSDELANGVCKIPTPNVGETVQTYANRFGLVAGDIYTIVCFINGSNDVYVSNIYDDVLATQKYCSFGFIRLIVKPFTGVTQELTTLEQLFDIEASSDISADVISGLKSFDIAAGSLNINLQLISGVNNATGALACIRSRRDQDLRSESRMVVNYGTNAENMFGIASDYLLDAWRAGTQSIGDSDLILEGGGI